MNEITDRTHTCIVSFIVLDYFASHTIFLKKYMYMYILLNVSRYYFDGVLVSSCGAMGVVGNLLTLCVLSRPKFRVRFLQVETQSS